MANTVSSVVMTPSKTILGPAGQYAFGPGDVQEPAFWLLATITGDGATTGVLTVNWIYGTQTLPFTPTAVLAFMTQSGTAAAGALGVEGSIGAANRVSAITNVSFGLSITTAITNAATAVVLVAVFK
jgi:hypothetical protein